MSRLCYYREGVYCVFNRILFVFILFSRERKHSFIIDWDRQKVNIFMAEEDADSERPNMFFSYAILQ